MKNLNFDKWAEVVTHPLGLVGFALFLVFLLLAVRSRRSQGKLLNRIFATLSVVVVIGGLVIAYYSPVGKIDPTTQDTSESTGSPAVSGVKGNVNIKVQIPGPTPQEYIQGVN